MNIKYIINQLIILKEYGEIQLYSMKFKIIQWTLKDSKGIRFQNNENGNLKKFENDKKLCLLLSLNFCLGYVKLVFLNRKASIFVLLLTERFHVFVFILEKQCFCKGIIMKRIFNESLELFVIGNSLQEDDILLMSNVQKNVL